MDHVDFGVDDQLKHIETGTFPALPLGPQKRHVLVGFEKQAVDVGFSPRADRKKTGLYSQVVWLTLNTWHKTDFVAGFFFPPTLAKNEAIKYHCTDLYCITGTTTQFNQT